MEPPKEASIAYAGAGGITVKRAEWLNK